MTTFSLALLSAFRILYPLTALLSLRQCSTRPHNLTGVLHKANDWKLSFDSVDRKLVVPPYLAISTLRPDILLISKGSKRVIMIELTLPCEENMETRHKDTLGFKALYGPLEI